MTFFYFIFFLINQYFFCFIFLGAVYLEGGLKEAKLLFGRLLFNSEVSCFVYVFVGLNMVCIKNKHL